MTVVGNFYFSIFLRLMLEFLDLESEHGGSVCWPNNKIIDSLNAGRNYSDSLSAVEIPRFIYRQYFKFSIIMLISWYVKRQLCPSMQ